MLGGRVSLTQICRASCPCGETCNPVFHSGAKLAPCVNRIRGQDFTAAENGGSIAVVPVFVNEDPPCIGGKMIVDPAILKDLENVVEEKAIRSRLEFAELVESGEFTPIDEHAVKFLLARIEEGGAGELLHATYIVFPPTPDRRVGSRIAAEIKRPDIAVKVAVGKAPD